MRDGTDRLIEFMCAFAKIILTFVVVAVVATAEGFVFGLFVLISGPVKPAMGPTLVKFAIFIGIQLVVYALLTRKSESR